MTKKAKGRKAEEGGKGRHGLGNGGGKRKYKFCRHLPPLPSSLLPFAAQKREHGGGKQMRTSATYNRARMLARKNRQRNGACVLDGTESERAQRGPTDFSTFSTWSTWRSSLPVAKLVSETAVTERLILNFERKRWASERSRFALTLSLLRRAAQPDRMTSNERGSLLRSPVEAIAILTPSAATERERASEREISLEFQLVSTPAAELLSLARG